MSARTRSWGQAERLAQSELDKREPVKIELKRIANEEAKKATEQQAKQIAFADSLDRWIAGLKIPDGPTRDSYDSFRRKFIGWTERVGVLMLHEVTADLLDEWRGKWDLDAEEPENRMASNTQSFLLKRIRPLEQEGIDYAEASPTHQQEDGSHIKHRCRVMLEAIGEVGALQRFNPHPASLPGDAAIAIRIGPTIFCFNPHPASLPGDARTSATINAKLVVSIHTQHRCRVMRRVGVKEGVMMGFNPHPASLPGDAYRPDMERRSGDVSIHTQHRCRVMLGQLGVPASRARFQSTPSIAAG